MKTGRNDPCPCGSGNKYKYCCGSESAQVEPRFRFEAGGYGHNGRFMPSIACYKLADMGQEEEEKEYLFVLLNPNVTYEFQDQAAMQSNQDLTDGYVRRDQTGSDAVMASYLKEQGYISATDFNTAQH